MKTLREQLEGSSRTIKEGALGAPNFSDDVKEIQSACKNCAVLSGHNGIVDEPCYIHNEFCPANNKMAIKKMCNNAKKSFSAINPGFEDLDPDMVDELMSEGDIKSTDVVCAVLYRDGSTTLSALSSEYGVVVYI